LVVFIAVILIGSTTVNSSEVDSNTDTDADASINAAVAAENAAVAKAQFDEAVSELSTELESDDAENEADSEEIDEADEVEFEAEEADADADEAEEAAKSEAELDAFGESADTTEAEGEEEDQSSLLQTELGKPKKKDDKPKPSDSNDGFKKFVRDNVKCACKLLERHNSDELKACKRQCKSIKGCNVVNYNRFTRICDLRKCEKDALSGKLKLNKKPKNAVRCHFISTPDDDGTDPATDNTAADNAAAVQPQPQPQLTCSK